LFCFIPGKTCPKAEGLRAAYEPVLPAISSYFTLLEIEETVRSRSCEMTQPRMRIPFLCHEQTLYLFGAIAVRNPPAKDLVTKDNFRVANLYDFLADHLPEKFDSERQQECEEKKTKPANSPPVDFAMNR